MCALGNYRIADGEKLVSSYIISDILVFVNLKVSINMLKVSFIKCNFIYNVLVNYLKLISLSSFHRPGSRKKQIWNLSR